jgi:hypothetical protein
MSGGVTAIEGFDYQAIVILGLSLEHFERQPGGSVRPEGRDDASLLCVGSSRVVFVQVKKPSRSDDGDFTGKSWRVAAAASALLEDTIVKLRDPNAEQWWVLGDSIDAELAELVAAGLDAPTSRPGAFVRALRFLALNRARVDGKVRQRVGQLHAPNDLDAMVSLIGAELPADKAAAFCKAVSELAIELPSTLARTKILAEYGDESSVFDRVCQSLVTRYGCSPAVARLTLARNLRGFINDVAKQRRAFDGQELELEVRLVWPHMVVVQEPPLLGPNQVPRTAVVEMIRTRLVGPATEIIAVSGAGKTRVAGELVTTLRAAGFLTLYAPVREETLRDLLAGVGYVLRRFGEAELFSIVTQSGADEVIIEGAARVLSALTMPVTIVIDAVDGDVSDLFARDLARLVREVRGSKVQLVSFGQTSLLREVSGRDRAWLRLTTLSLPGFSFEEFVDLAEHFGSSDRAVLYQVFERVTAARTGGMLAITASTLARSPLSEMVRLAELPPTDTLAYAEQARFNAIPQALRRAAERVVCAILPFRPADLAAIFPEPVALAIRDLEQRGLLERYQPDRVEMHESVRSALESFLPQAIKQETHRTLAAHYGSRGEVASQILHLRRAGEESEADHLARDAFLTGRVRTGLAQLIAERRLLSADEIVGLFAGTNFGAWYLLPDILAVVGTPHAGARLVNVIRADSGRLESDFSWANRITEAVLACAPALLGDLFDLVARQEKDSFDLLDLALRRRPCDVPDALLARFRARRSPYVSRIGVLMLSDSRVSVAAEAFSYFAEAGFDDTKARLRIETRADADRLLAALPAVESGQLIINRSPSFGRLTELLWSHRFALIPVCRAVLGEVDGVPPRSVTIALRLLWLFADREGLASVAIPRGHEAHILTSLVKVLLDLGSTESELRSVVMDAACSWDDRMGAFAQAVFSGVDLDILWRGIATTHPGEIDQWRVFFIGMISFQPFRQGAVLLEQQLEQPKLDGLAVVYVRLALVQGDEVTDVFIRGLKHTSPRVRVSCARALTTRRVDRAFEPLLQAAESESEPRLALAHANAAFSSRPTSTTPFRELAERIPDATWLWVVLIGRLRSIADAAALVQIATDRTRSWTLRRAAIASAARLPPELALDEIAPCVLAESTDLQDGNSALQGHEQLIALLSSDDGTFVGYAANSAEDAFIARYHALYDDMSKDLIDAGGIPSGQVALGWLWQQFREAIERGLDPAKTSLNRLHVPALHAAVLRAYRMLGRARQLESLFATSPNLWFAMRNLVELGRIARLDGAAAARVRSLVAGRSQRDQLFLGRVLEGITARPRQPPLAGLEDSPSPAATPSDPVEVKHVLEQMGQGRVPSVDNRLVGADLGQWRALVSELTPSRDHRLVVAPPTEPQIAVTSTTFSLRQNSVRRVSNHAEARALLRPLVAIDGPSQVEIPWHTEQLRSGAYVARLGEAIARTGDRDALLRVVKRDPSVLLLWTDWKVLVALTPLVDERMVPHLMLFTQSGSDESFHTLCTFAAAIDHASVEPLLGALLARWGREIRDQPRRSKNTKDWLWSGFSQMKKSPRLLAAHEAIDILQNATLLPLYHWNKKSVVDVLVRAPQAYALLERLLLRAGMYTTFNHDEIDTLDEACERFAVPQSAQSS